MPTTFSRRQDTGVRAWVRRHPLTAFLIMGFGLALLVMSVAILAQIGVIPGRSLPGRVGLEMERVAAVHPGVVPCRPADHRAGGRPSSPA